MSYVLLMAIKRNLSRKNHKYSGIFKDIDVEYGVANKHFFKPK